MIPVCIFILYILYSPLTKPPLSATISPRNPTPRKNPDPPPKTLLPSLHKKRQPHNRSILTSPLQNATPPKTPLQSIRSPKTINHTHHHPPRAPSPVFAPIPRIPQSRLASHSALTTPFPPRYRHETPYPNTPAMAIRWNEYYISGLNTIFLGLSRQR